MIAHSTVFHTHTHMYVMTMKLRDTLHQSDIQTKKTRCAVYTHIEENKGHTIDWEKRTFLDKDKALRNEKLKQLVIIVLRIPLNFFIFARK